MRVAISGKDDEKFLGEESDASAPKAADKQPKSGSSAEIPPNAGSKRQNF